MSELVLAAILGFAAGGLSGMFGVGGGILFVPTLVLVLDLSQLEGQATSLAAMIPVVAVGAWRQHRYGNVRWRSAAVIGVTSIAGVAGGTVVATSLSDNALRKLFALLLVLVAVQLVRSARRPGAALPGP
jgi:uncharacterized protein